MTYTYIITIITPLLKIEYLALLISVISIFISVHISKINSVYQFRKEKYFKYKEYSLNIIAKLLIIDKQIDMFYMYIKSSNEAAVVKSELTDLNNTFSKDLFEKENELTAAILYVHFPDLCEEWNICLDKISLLYNLTYAIKIKTDSKIAVNWDDVSTKYNSIVNELNNRPKSIADRIKQELEKQETLL